MPCPPFTILTIGDAELSGACSNSIKKEGERQARDAEVGVPYNTRDAGVGVPYLREYGFPSQRIVGAADPGSPK